MTYRQLIQQILANVNDLNELVETVVVKNDEAVVPKDLNLSVVHDNRHNPYMKLVWTIDGEARID